MKDNNKKESNFLKQPLFWSAVSLVGILFFLVLNIAYISNAPHTLAQAVPVAGEGTPRFLAKWVEPVLPPPPPLPTVTLSASPPNPINYNTAATLTWSSTNADSCTASGAWSGSKAVSGSLGTGNLIASQTYTLTCTNATGSASQSATVTVNPPTPDFTLSKSNDIEVTIVGGVPHSSNTSTITALASGSFANAISFSAVVSPPISGITYTFAKNPLTSGDFTSGSSFKVTVLANTPSRTYIITVTGVGGSITRTVPITLKVVNTNLEFEEF